MGDPELKETSHLMACPLLGATSPGSEQSLSRVLRMCPEPGKDKCIIKICIATQADPNYITLHITLKHWYNVNGMAAPSCMCVRCMTSNEKS